MPCCCGDDASRVAKYNILFMNSIQNSIHKFSNYPLIHPHIPLVLTMNN